MYEDLKVDIIEGVATVTLNRPEKLNALRHQTWAELENAFRSLSKDDDVKVVVLTGAGRGFCSGTDLSPGESSTTTFVHGVSKRESLTRSFLLATDQIRSTRQPVIAAVNGVAVGGGLSLALCCDVRIAASSAKFSSIFVKRALVPDTGSSWLLPRLVGTERALRMMWSGEMIGATDALSMGLVSEVVDDKDLLARAHAFARQLTLGPSAVIEATKRLVYDGLSQNLAAQIQLEGFVNHLLSHSEDRVEALAAYRERREPVFRE